MKIERKFLVNTSSDVNISGYKNIIQGYLSFSPEIRIRNMNDSEYYITQKSDGDLLRDEVEIKIDEKTFNILSNLLTGRIISKTRYYIPLDNNVIAELDVYFGNFKGLVTVEVEFLDEEEAYNFNVPEWFGQEITTDKRFKNKNLAKCNDEELKKILFPKKIKIKSNRAW